MSSERKAKVAPEGGTVAIPLEWSEEADLPTVYANQLFISHAGPEFFLVFGEVSTPLWTRPSPEKLTALGALKVKPVAKIAISPEAMPEIAKVIGENVEKFLARNQRSKKRRADGK